MERWLPVRDWADLYEVSDHGRIRSLRRGGRVLRPKLTSGYPTIQLSLDGVQVTRYIHQLVLEAFVGPRPDRCEVRHLNGDRRDVRLANLRWGTRSENARDAVRHGTHWETRKVRCSKGHSYTDPANCGTTTRPDGRTRRYCRACNRDWKENARVQGPAAAPPGA